jgi:hypothetical protein
MSTPTWTLEEACSPDLDAQLGRLSAWLRELDTPPDWNRILTPEWSRILITENVRLFNYMTVRLPGDEIWTPAQYQERFSRLARAGYSWINIETLGILNSALVTTIVVPRDVLGIPQTQVMLSGPMRFVCETPGWGLERYLIIDGAV